MIDQPRLPMTHLKLQLKGDVVHATGLFGSSFEFVEIPVEEFRRFARETLGMREAGP